jgi:hypothetical protein
MPATSDLIRILSDYASLVQTFFKSPSSGRLLISVLPNPERFIIELSPTRITMDTRSAFDAMILATVEDYKSLPYAFEVLRNYGYLKPRESVTILNLDSGEVSIFHPWQINDTRNLMKSYPKTPYEIYRYEGMITTYDPSKPEEHPFIKSKIFRPWVDPIKEMMKRLSQANVTMIKETMFEKFDNLLVQYTSILDRKRIIQIT